MSPTRWVLASGNPGKLRELQQLLAPLGITLLRQQEFRLEPALENAPTFLENALIKARHLAQVCQLPALADDSGLLVDALDGAPGVHSARFAGAEASDAQNNALLLERLEGVPEEQRTAFFHCSLVWLRTPQDAAPLVAQGNWQGHILSAPAGEGGFGYDPLFRPQGMSCSAAQLPAPEKARHSHRAQALRALLHHLQLS